MHNNKIEFNNFKDQSNNNQIKILVSVLIDLIKTHLSRVCLLVISLYSKMMKIRMEINKMLRKN
jgi:hypothetical protein